MGRKAPQVWRTSVRKFRNFLVPLYCSMIYLKRLKMTSLPLTCVSLCRFGRDWLFARGGWWLLGRSRQLDHPRRQNSRSAELKAALAANAAMIRSMHEEERVFSVERDLLERRRGEAGERRREAEEKVRVLLFKHKLRPFSGALVFWGRTPEVLSFFLIRFFFEYSLVSRLAYALPWCSLRLALHDQITCFFDIKNVTLHFMCRRFFRAVAGGAVEGAGGSSGSSGKQRQR